MENRFDFTDLKECTLQMAVVDYPMPGTTDTADTVATSVIKLPSVAPRLTAFVDLGLPEDWEEHDAVELTATDPHGRLVMHRTLPITTPERTAAALLENIAPARAAQLLAERANDTPMNDGGSEITLTAGGVTVSLNRGNGTINTVRNTSGPISLTNGPWLRADTAAVTKRLEWSENDTRVVQFIFDGPLDTLTYRMLPNGLLQLDYAYFVGGSHDFMGITFDYPEDKVTGVRYLGDGPYRVWKNRLRGVNFGLHEKTYNNAVTGERWEYPEFKGYYSNLHWATIETTEQPFTIITATPGKYLHLFTPEAPRGAHNDNTQGRFPTGNLSIMDAISPIGSKFKPAPELGPGGMQNEFRAHRGGKSVWGGRVLFDFRANP